MVRSLSAIVFLTLFFCTAIANAQDAPKKGKKGKADTESTDLDKKLKAQAELRQERIEDLESYVKKGAKEMTKLRERINALQGNPNRAPQSIDEEKGLREKYNAVVAKYNANLPKASAAANGATSDYNKSIGKYNQVVATYNRIVEEYNRLIATVERVK